MARIWETCKTIASRVVCVPEMVHHSDATRWVGAPPTGALSISADLDIAPVMDRSGTSTVARVHRSRAIKLLLATAAIALVSVFVAVSPVGALALLAQDQTEVDDGTRPMRILAIAMGVLAVLLGVLTYFYWKATTPPARRGYLPMPDWSAEPRLERRPSPTAGEVAGAPHVEAEPRTRPPQAAPSLRDSLKARPVLGDKLADSGN